MTALRKDEDPDATRARAREREAIALVQTQPIDVAAILRAQSGHSG